jgi:hypothetical protein
VDCKTDIRDKQQQSSHQPTGTTARMPFIWNEKEGAFHPLHLTCFNLVVVGVRHRRQLVGPLGLRRGLCRRAPRGRPRPLPHARLRAYTARSNRWIRRSSLRDAGTAGRGEQSGDRPTGRTSSGRGPGHLGSGRGRQGESPPCSPAGGWEPGTAGRGGGGRTRHRATRHRATGGRPQGRGAETERGG